jgi:hypothetical protein
MKDSVGKSLLRIRNSVGSETNTASGRQGAIQADDDQQKNTERRDLLVLVPAAIAKFNERGRDGCWYSGRGYGYGYMGCEYGDCGNCGNCGGGGGCLYSGCEYVYG